MKTQNMETRHLQTADGLDSGVVGRELVAGGEGRAVRVVAAGRGAAAAHRQLAVVALDQLLDGLLLVLAAPPPVPVPGVRLWRIQLHGQEWTLCDL